jgi:sugar lactone lactonase YvrE
MRQFAYLSRTERVLRWAIAVFCGFSLAACGGGGGPGVVSSLASDSQSQSNSSAGVQQDLLSLIAGDIGGPGSLDGNASTARFYDPQALAVDSAGNIYIADTANNTIRRISSAGAVSTIAGKDGIAGSADGNGGDARFSSPSGITVDANGNVYVSDTGNDIIRKITSDGVVSTIAGTSGVSGSTDGSGSGAQFDGPYGIKADTSGNLYVADTNNHTIRKITSAGVVTTLAGSPATAGTADGNSATARFNGPHGIAIDGAGNIYVTDTQYFPASNGGGYNSTIRKITPSGIVSTIAGAPFIHGYADGNGSAAQFDNPSGITVDAAGNLYVADTYNHSIRKISPAGVVTTFAGTKTIGSDDGTGTQARFFYPAGIASDTAGNLYVADTSNSTIRRITQNAVVTTIAGVPAKTGGTDGASSNARFSGPSGITADASGNLYVADTYNGTIRKIDGSGNVSTFAGTAGVEGHVDATGAAAQFIGPAGMASDTAGNLYVADSGNNVIRRISPAGVVTTVAGNGTYGSVDGNAATAEFASPMALALDKAGNIYVADTNNHTIRKITPAGVVSVFAGAPQVSGSADGVGASARFASPSGIAVDGSGNVYVSDTYNHTIRKITSNGVVTTLAGVAGSSGDDDGTGTAARFYFPNGITVDDTGNIYVADTLNQTIRRINSSGVVITVAGVAQQQGIVLGGLPGNLSQPSNLTLIGSNTLAVTTGNSVVRITLP